LLTFISQVNDAYDKLDEYEERLEKTGRRLDTFKQRVRELEDEVQKRIKAMEIQLQENLSTVSALEQEKRQLVEQVTLLEQKIDVEKLKADTNQATRQIAVRYSLGMKEQYLSSR